MFAFQWREFPPPPVNLRPQTPPIDKGEIGDAAIPGERPAPPPPPRAPTRAIANEHTVSSASRCDVAHSGRENLHHFLPVLLRGMLPLFSIMTLWVVSRPLLNSNIK